MGSAKGSTDVHDFGLENVQFVQLNIQPCRCVDLKARFLRHHWPLIDNMRQDVTLPPPPLPLLIRCQISQVRSLFTLHLQATSVISQRDVHVGGQDVWKCRCTFRLCDTRRANKRQCFNNGHVKWRSAGEAEAFTLPQGGRGGNICAIRWVSTPLLTCQTTSREDAFMVK